MDGSLQTQSEATSLNRPPKSEWLSESLRVWSADGSAASLPRLYMGWESYIYQTCQQRFCFKQYDLLAKWR